MTALDYIAGVLFLLAMLGAIWAMPKGPSKP